SVDVILAHLTLASALALIFRGVPNTSSLGISHVTDDIGCKIVLSVQRVIQSISLHTTSLQTVFQAVTVTPSDYKWVWLKSKIIFPSLFFLWNINMLIYIEVILTMNSISKCCVHLRFVIPVPHGQNMEQCPPGDFPLQTRQDGSTDSQSYPLPKILTTKALTSSSCR
ncbi:hypothetical protein HPG69_010269, partial [Diceros bicornis minor]